MMALLGCSLEDFEGILSALGYKKTTLDLMGEDLEAEKKELDAFINTLTTQGSAKPQETPPSNLRKKITGILP